METTVHYEVEVNLGRRGGNPVWYPMIEGEVGPSAKWDDLPSLMAEASDQLWSDYRVIEISDDGRRFPIETKDNPQ